MLLGMILGAAVTLAALRVQRMCRAEVVYELPPPADNPDRGDPFRP